LADDGGRYFLQQTGNCLWWLGLSAPDQVLSHLVYGLQPGLSFSNVLRGVISSDFSIAAQWADVPKGSTQGLGTLALVVRAPTSDQGDLEILKQGETGTGFGGGRWWRGSLPQAGPCAEVDIACKFSQVQRNDEGTMARHMSGGGGPNAGLFRDNVVVYGSLVDGAYVNYPGFPGAVDLGARPLDRSYAHFMCADGGADDQYKWFDGDIGSDPPDGDINFDVNIQGFDGYYDNNLASTYLAGQPANQAGHVHAEMIMYGRNATRDNCQGAALTVLPGWADSGSNSVLLNGRPLNGSDPAQVVVADERPGGGACDGIYHNENLSCLVTSLGGQTFAAGELVRVAGVLARDEHGGPGVEIHPVYSVDIVNPPSSDDLTGVWGGSNDRGTYYVRQIPEPGGSSVVWWLGTSADLGRTFATVFRGIRGQNNVITGDWGLVPIGLGGEWGTGTASVSVPDQSIAVQGGPNGFLVLRKMYA